MELPQESEIVFTPKDLALMVTHDLRNLLNALLAHCSTIGELEVAESRVCLALEEKVEQISLLCQDFDFSESMLDAIESEYRGLLSQLRSIYQTLTDANLRVLRASYQELDQLIVAKMVALRENILHPRQWMRQSPLEFQKDINTAVLGMEQAVLGPGTIVTERDHWNQDSWYLHWQEVPLDSLHFPFELKEVLPDLILNSRKYSPPGSTIQLTLQRIKKGLEVIVRDNGPGIKESQIQSLVKPGVRGHTGGSSAGGYGLSRALWFARRWYGELGILTKPQAGTQIRLWIPLENSALTRLNA